MVKVVENNERICTVNLDGSECSIVFQSHYKYFTVKNESDSKVYISLKRDIVPEADGVMTVNSKESATITNMQPNVNMFFASGSGKIQVFASNSDKFVNPFKYAPVSDGGGDKIITPESLGYADGAAMFFDGIYNFPNKHVNNNYGWVDIANDNIMIRNNLSGSVHDNHYDKLSGSDSIFIAPAVTYDNFTVEIVFDIISVPTSECDMASNFNRSGFGIYTYDNALRAVIHNGNAYVGAILSSFATGTKYAAQLVYDGNVFTAYINGVAIGAVQVSLDNYNKSTEPFMLGGLISGSYSDGAYNYYRFAVYDKVLTDTQLKQNYNTDVERFNL